MIEREHRLIRRKLIVLIIVSVAATLFSFHHLSNAPDPKPYTLQYPPYFGNRFTIPEDNPMTEPGVRLGRLLFYEQRLSRGNSMSCGSCHLQRLAFTDPRPFSQGVDGTFSRRNAMSLANLLWVKNLFWDGRSPGLEAQAVVPMTDVHEMGQSMEQSAAKIGRTLYYPALFDSAFGSPVVSGDRIVKAIAQFERTLISASAPYDQYLNGTRMLSGQELRGMNLFMTAPVPAKNIRGANCGHCHGTPKLFKELFHNNGIGISQTDSGRSSVTGQSIDRGRFRVPTLRNIALTAPYMHDGRLQTLAAVLDHYNEHVQPGENVSTFITQTTNTLHGKSLSLTDQEKKDIISFLNTLTDSVFIINPKFSDPHLRVE